MIVILGLLAAIGPKTIFPVCPAEEMKMRCFTTANAELAVGIIGAVIGIALFVIKDKKLGIMLSAAEAVIGLFVVLIPAVIIGVCGNAMMHCVTVTRPALIVIGIILVIVSLINILLFLRDISIEKKTR